jgi:protein-S-isoprenylcysteine O-methyltransferase Ste14
VRRLHHHLPISLHAALIRPPFSDRTQARQRGSEASRFAGREYSCAPSELQQSRASQSFPVARHSLTENLGRHGASQLPALLFWAARLKIAVLAANLNPERDPDAQRCLECGVKPAVRLAIIMTGTAAYLGLAILGWGGFAAFFCHPAFAALAITLFAMSVTAFFAGGNLSPGEREDRANRWVLIAFGVLGLLEAYLPAYTDRMEFWTLDGHTIRWLGIGLFAAGGLLRLWPVFVLGDRFSGLVAIQPGHTLVNSGIYGVIRHPSYLGLLVSSLGWGLAFRSGLGVLLTALTVPPLLVRISAEERLLRTQFGDEYDAYRARTSRLIPGLY